ncbi:unnamed protein product, partial [marine sediment metagenome]
HFFNGGASGSDASLRVSATNSNIRANSLAMDYGQMSIFRSNPSGPPKIKFYDGDPGVSGSAVMGGIGTDADGTNINFLGAAGDIVSTLSAVGGNLQTDGTLDVDGTGTSYIGGALDVEGNTLTVGDGLASNKTLVFNDDGTQSLKWDDGDGRFELSSMLEVTNWLIIDRTGSPYLALNEGTTEYSRFVANATNIQIKDGTNPMVDFVRGSGDATLRGTLDVDGTGTSYIGGDITVEGTGVSTIGGE